MKHREHLILDEIEKEQWEHYVEQCKIEDMRLVDTITDRQAEKEWDNLWNDIKKLQKSDKSKGEWIEEMQKKYKLAKR